MAVIIKLIILLSYTPSLIFAEDSQSNVDKLLRVIERITDREYDCPEEVSEYPAQEGPSPLELVDCEAKHARVDYSLKISSGEKLRRRQQLNGNARIQFADSKSNQQMKDGFRLAKCFRVNVESAVNVKATFQKDLLQGAIDIQLRNGTVLRGNVRDNKLYGTLRTFHQSSNNPNVSVIEVDYVGNYDKMLITQEFLSLFHVTLDKQSSLVIYKGEVFANCIRANSRGIYLRCNKVEAFDFKAKGCKLHVDVLKVDTSAYAINARLNKIKRNTDTREGICNFDGEVAPSSAISAWLDVLMSSEGDPFWDMDFSDMPLSQDDPTLNITVPLLKHRDSMKHLPIVLVNGRTPLLRGSFENGQLLVNISDYDISEWHGPLSFYSKIDKDTFDIALQATVAPGELEVSGINPLILGRLHLGKLHGPVRMYGQMSSDPKSTCTVKDKLSESLSFFGIFSDGIPTGAAWRGIYGGGWLYGKLDQYGEFSGDEIAYIYPDLELALLGKFDKGVMIEAQETEVTGLECNGDMMELTFAEPHGPYFHYDPPTFSSYGDQPLTVDPLEKKYVHVAPSDIGGAGRGLFASRDIPPGTLIAANAGVKVPKKSDVDHSPYRIGVRGCNYNIDLPAEVVENDAFLATLNHMINHSFNPTTSFTIFDSPRYGVIPGLKTKIFVKKGEELLCDYGYGFYPQLEWYGKMLKEHLGEAQYNKLKAAYKPEKV